MDRPTPYETDTHAWALEQAEALRARSANALDWDNLAEEIESLGKQQIAELRNRYTVLLAHLLKWAYQPARRSRSWENTVAEQRAQIVAHIGDNPSLQSKEADVFSSAYRFARLRASTETDLDVGVFPETAPFTLEQAKDRAWLPEAALDWNA